MPNIAEPCCRFEKHDFNGTFKLDSYGIDRRPFDYAGESSRETPELCGTRRRQEAISIEIFKQLSVNGKSDEEVIRALRGFENCERIDSGNPNYDIFSTEFAKAICEERGIPIPDRTLPMQVTETDDCRKHMEIPCWVKRR